MRRLVALLASMFLGLAVGCSRRAPLPPAPPPIRADLLSAPEGVRATKPLHCREVPTYDKADKVRRVVMLDVMGNLVNRGRRDLDVYVDVTVESGGRRYETYLYLLGPGEGLKDHVLMPPHRLSVGSDLSRTGRLEPAGLAGWQYVRPGLTWCGVRVREPTPAERAAGGWRIQNPTDEVTDLGEEGQVVYPRGVRLGTPRPS